MEKVTDRDAYLIGNALCQAGLLEDAKTYHAAGDDEDLSEIVAKALYEAIRLQDQIVSADQHGMRAILQAKFPNKLQELIEADKADGWKLGDWAEKELLQSKWRLHVNSSRRNGAATEVLTITRTQESLVLRLSP